MSEGVEGFPLALLAAMMKLADGTIAWRNLDMAQAAAVKAGEVRPPGEILILLDILDGLIEMIRAVPDWAGFALPLERLRLAVIDLQSGKPVGWLQPHRLIKDQWSWQIGPDIVRS